LIAPVTPFAALPFRRKETMAIDWIRDADAALAKAKQTNKRLLLDFSAAPM
jgi:hypothetical protein